MILPNLPLQPASAATALAAERLIRWAEPMESPRTASRGVVRAVVMVALTAVLMLTAWCLADLVYVRVQSGREFVRATEGVLTGAIFLGVFFSHWRLHRGEAAGVLAMLTTLFSAALAVVLIFYLGIPFHLWIGGDL